MKNFRPHSVDQAAISPYLKTIKDETLLTADQESSLAEAIARGDRDARTQMIQANLLLVVKIAQEYAGRGLSLDDLIGEGNIGLIRAIEDYEPSYGTRFCTYAGFWIKQAMQQALSNSMSMIRLPSHMLGLMNKWRRAEREMEREFLRKPTFNEVAASLGLTEIQKTLVRKAQQSRQVRQESTVTEGGDGWSSMNECDPYGPADSAVESRDDQYLLRSRMDTLDGRERIILTLRFGLENEMPMTHTQIGHRLGVTREWVRVMELKAFRKLRGEVTEVPGKETRRLRSTRPGKRTRKAAPDEPKPLKPQRKKKAKVRSVSRKAPQVMSHPLAAIGGPSIWNGPWPPLQ